MTSWHSYWFKPASAIVLGTYRIVLFSYLFLLLCVGLYLQKSYECAAFSPVGIFSTIHFPCSDVVIRITYLIGIFSSLFAASGYEFRIFGKVAAVSAMLVLGYEYNFHEIYHGYHVLIMTLLIVSFSRAGDACTLFSRGEHYTQTSYRYRWPVQLCKLYVVYVYFLVGAERLYFGGLEWVFSENLQILVFTKPQASVLGDWFLTLSTPSVIVFAFTAVFICEIFAPLALINKKTGALYWFLWLFFHIGVSLVLGRHKSFFSQVPAASVFLIPTLLAILKTPVPSPRNPSSATRQN